MKVAILQPHIPHYREEFFEKLSVGRPIKVYCYNSVESVSKDHFKSSDFKTTRIKKYFIGPFMWYNPIPFLQKDSDVLVLMLDIKHLTTWFLLGTAFIHKKKIILWGQGISIKRFHKDETQVFRIMKWFISLAAGVWFYTDNERNMWQRRLANLNAVSLNNTISGIEDILKVNKLKENEKLVLKNKYNITQPLILIFCARFNSLRRTDLLLEIIRKSNSNKIGFIIIGAGNAKPLFGEYPNVYDFGNLYDFQIKKELFSIADIYFQPAWLGLSTVEAMAYGLPVFSFKRSIKVLQCVEYFYVKNGNNGMLFNNTAELLEELDKLDILHITTMGQNARSFASENLSMDNMVRNAVSLL